MRELCEYYNVYISVDTMSRLSDELKCMPLTYSQPGQSVIGDSKASSGMQVLKFEDLPSSVTSLAKSDSQRSNSGVPNTNG